MFLLASVAPFIVLTSTVVANSIAVRDSYPSLSLKKVVKSTGTGRNLVHGHQGRANNDIPSSLNTISYFLTSIGIGEPPTMYDLVVDTGSANTWVGADKPYNQTHSAVKTYNSVNITYLMGFTMTGIEYTDTVTLTPAYVLSYQAISVAHNFGNFTGADGILGLGPNTLTTGTLHPDVNATIPTVMDNLYEGGAITSEAFSIFFVFNYTGQYYVANGNLLYGTIDHAQFIGNLWYAPLSKTYPANLYWSVDLSVKYGALSILDDTPCEVDSGSATISLPQRAYDLYSGATGAILDSKTGFLRISSNSYSNLESLNITIGDMQFPLNSNAQIFPRAINAAIGGSLDYFYLTVVLSAGRNGVPRCSLGSSFLERYYTVFNANNRSIGFAPTRFTNWEVN